MRLRGGGGGGGGCYLLLPWTWNTERAMASLHVAHIIHHGRRRSSYITHIIMIAHWHRR